MKVMKDFYFSAAHCLGKMPSKHKCRVMHGHNYRVRVECERDATTMIDDMVIDFDAIKEIVHQSISKLDHQFINNVIDYNNPTSEHLCLWFKDQLINELPLLSAIEVWESDHAGARWDRAVKSAGNES